MRPSTIFCFTFAALLAIVLIFGEPLQGIGPDIAVIQRLAILVWITVLVIGGALLNRRAP